MIACPTPEIQDADLPCLSNKILKLTNMKKGSLFILAGVIITMSIADVLSSLDLTREKANELIVASFGEGGLSVERAIVLKAKSLPEEERVEGVRELIKIARAYSESEAFKSDYKKWRNQKLNGKSKGRLGLPNPGKLFDNAIDKTMNKKENETKYPSDPAVLIRERLTEFLRISGTVDFDAELDGTSFADEKYEKKSHTWKMCFRAGKPVIDAAREEAEVWLKSLE